MPWPNHCLQWVLGGLWAESSCGEITLADEIVGYVHNLDLFFLRVQKTDLRNEVLSKLFEI